jgi:hypothetical protein
MMPWRPSRRHRHRRALAVSNQLWPRRRHQNTPRPRLGLLTMGIELGCLLALVRNLSDLLGLGFWVHRLRRAWLHSTAKLAC